MGDNGDFVTLMVTWFNTENPMLGNVTPLDLLKAGRGEKLAQFIETAIEEGNSPPKYGCHCDLENMPEGYQPDNCVMDYGDYDSCVYATRLHREGKTQAACEYWQPIKFKAPASREAEA